MATPSSGTIGFDDIAAELGRSVANISLNDADVRELAGIASGPISFNDLRGKSAFSLETIATPSPKFCFAGGGPCQNSTTMTVIANGSGPFTYQWVKVSGDSQIGFSSVTTNSSVTVRSTASSGVFTATYRCDVTQGGETLQSNTVTVDHEHST